jgi:hypothetical protein
MLDANLALAFNAVIERAEFCRELTDPPHDLADCGVRALSYDQRSWLFPPGLGGRCHSPQTQHHLCMLSQNCDRENRHHREKGDSHADALRCALLGLRG